MAGYELVCAPLDCSASGRGEERGPDALLDAGLARRLGAGVRKLDIRIRSDVRDAATGVLALEPIRAASREIAGAVSDVLGACRTPFVVGGDCALLPGALSGARRRIAGPIGLAFIDGQADAYDGHSSPTGEVADMDLGIVTGSVAVDLTGDPAPLVAPSDAVVVGYRDGEPVEAGRCEVDLLDPAVHTVSASAVEQAPQALRAIAGREVWVHVDADVFDPEVMPAVTYPEPAGLGFDEATRVVAAVRDSATIVGISLADFVPDLDPDGRHAAALVDWAVAAFQS